MELRVSEIFMSIQGEGPNVGRPAVFLRLNGCNLRCMWCDTKYALSGGKRMTEEAVLEQIKRYPCDRLVITGGEPLLQQDDLTPLLKKLKNYRIEVETNGSIPLKIGQYIEQINCSPKLKNSGNRAYEPAIRPSKKTIYKFVVKESADLEDIRRFIKTNRIPRESVYLMPEGTKADTLLRRSKWIIEVCKKEGYNFSPRLHILLYGSQRKK
ncbi:7-carboxy-7-deazaguanine synthase QueE [Candidatus Peregrinibacteria bacterium]|nr:7-carboxy-7-deazaguanine synthase QueE [Candidatus Peregrinibacteria bacterium]